MKRLNNKICSALVGILLCTTGAVMGQTHHPMHAGLPLHKGDPGSRPGKSIPAFDLRVKEEIHMVDAAQAALEAGDYEEEENYAQQAVDLGIGSGKSNDLLAQSLRDQGKDDKALQAYKVIVVDHKDDNQDNLVPYAMLLLKAGHWPQAVAITNRVLPRVGNGQTLLASSRFSPNVPEPATLAAVLHIAQGLLYQEGQGWGHRSQQEKGMREFAEAVRLQPNAALANYYYGSGLKRTGRRAQAQAAFKKAASLDNGEVKAAAEKALIGR